MCGALRFYQYLMCGNAYDIREMCGKKSPTIWGTTGEGPAEGYEGD